MGRHVIFARGVIRLTSRRRFGKWRPDLAMVASCHDAEAREQDREQMKNLFIDLDVTRRRKEVSLNLTDAIYRLMKRLTSLQ